MRIDSYETFTDRDGNKIRKHIRASSIAEYNRKVEKIKAELNHAPLVSDVVDEWQEHHFKSINLNTQSGYIAPMKNIKEYFGDKHLDELNPLDIDRFLYDLFNDYNYAKQTLKLRLIVLNQVCNYGIVKGYIKYNPCSAVKLPNKAVSGKRELPLPQDIETVKNKVKSHKFGLFPFFIRFSGLRKGEALALDYEDIDRKNGTIKVNKTLIFDGNNPIIQYHAKTEAGNRIVPLLKPLAKVLPKKRKGLVFGNEGKPYTKSQFNVEWRRYRRETGVNMNVHQLRHAFATTLYEAGIGIKDAQEILGHASPEVTQKIYTHISKEQQNKAFKQLNDFVG